MTTFTNSIQLVYVLAAACFVVGLHLMNSPATARRGNQVSTAGMVIAVIATLVLLIHGRYDRMVAFEVSIAIVNYITDSRLILLNNCCHWSPFEKPAE